MARRGRYPAHFATMRLSWRNAVLKSGVGFSSLKQGLMAALFASFLALFVLVPGVDAMTCGPESSPSGASILIFVDQSDNDDHDEEIRHATCAHGHCHDAGVSGLGPHGSLLAGVRAGAPELKRPVDRLVSSILAGPERPPRT